MLIRVYNFHNFTTSTLLSSSPHKDHLTCNNSFFYEQFKLHRFIVKDYHISNFKEIGKYLVDLITKANNVYCSKLKYKCPLFLKG